MKINSQSRLRLNFSLSLAEGQIIDSNFDAEPVTMKIGDGNMLPGFEAHLIGMTTGDTKEVLVPAMQAFGEHNSDNLQQFDRQHFASDVEQQEGLVVSFSDANGSELPGVVTALSDKQVKVDFNHPLAGRDIVFTVKIASVENYEN